MGIDYDQNNQNTFLEGNIDKNNKNESNYFSNDNDNNITDESQFGFETCNNIEEDYSSFRSEESKLQNFVSKEEKFLQNNFINENTRTKENTNINETNVPEKINNDENSHIEEFDELRIEINREENISENNNKEKKQLIFDFLKKGNKKKNQRNNRKNKHGKNSFDNARKKIFNSCKMSIYNFINETIQNKYGFKLHVPTIEKQLGYSYRNNKKFIEKKVYKIFCDTSPKRVKEQIKYGKVKYNYNQNIIDRLLDEEKNDPRVNIKKLNIIFNLSFGDFLIAYLNDLKEIKTNDNYIIGLKGFKTFRQCFNERKDKYTQAQKNMFRKNILDIIQGQTRNRKPRSLKNIHN